MTSIPQRFGNLSPLKQALLALEEMEARLAASDRQRNEPIAVIGMGCRFPGAANPEKFWRALQSGTDAVTEIPKSRWNLDDYYDPNPDAPGKMSTRYAALLDQVTDFDPEFFGISPREAAAMDPQQRLLLEVTWEALENAAQNPRDLARHRAGVFVALTTDEYAQMFYRAGDPSIFNAYFASGIARSVAGGRISYTLGIEGPNLSVDTACSSSLVALHTACLYLRAGECRLAIAGGSNVLLSPEIFIAFSKAHMMAPDGRCKAFDSRANGFVRGEGCGVVVLKRLSDAIADRDNILAVLRGSAVNQDGRSSGLTAPNGRSQENVIRAALSKAGLKPSEIDYIEAHGTGTELGDPIEAHALAGVFGEKKLEKPLVVGSVKTNLGHLESAAGVAGLLKIILSLQHNEIPKHLHFQQMNPHIDWKNLAVEIPVEARKWEKSGRKRIAGVSSFGFSGTNAHVIVEEAPTRERIASNNDRPLHILTSSARDETALRQLQESYVEALGSLREPIADICYSANAGRATFDHRLFVVGANTEEIRQKLRDKKSEGHSHASNKKAVWLFPGQGSQFHGMGKQLYDTQPIFRAAIDECAAILKSENIDLPEILWGTDSEKIHETANTQVALFAVEWALAQLWKSWGVEPAAILGHSVGEYVGVTVAGVYTLAEGLELIALRGRLMSAAQGHGSMLAVIGDEAKLHQAIAGIDISIAAENPPGSFTLAGYSEHIDQAAEKLTQLGLRVERLKVSHAFHSAQMDQMRAEFEHATAQLAPKDPQIRLISSVTGRELSKQEITPQYWGRQIRDTVRFRQAMETLHAHNHHTFLEIGPGTTLCGLGRQTITQESTAWLPTLRRQKSDWEQTLDALGQYWQRGGEVDWEKFDAPYAHARYRVPLPTYPFQRQHYWIDAPKPTPYPKSKFAATQNPAGAHPLLGAPVELAGDTHIRVWENLISTASVPFLADHRAHDAAIFPLTGYIEIMLAALTAAGHPHAALLNISIGAPLLTPDADSARLQTVLHDDKIEIFSRSGNAWLLHCSASFSVAAAPAPSPATESLDQLKSKTPESTSPETFYGQVREKGMNFGPSFRAIRELRHGPTDSLAKIEPPAEIRADAPKYWLHPAVLDACFQSIAPLLARESDSLYLPVSLAQFLTLRSPSVAPSAPHTLFAHATRRDKSATNSSTATFNIYVFDSTGPIAEITSLEMRKAPRTALTSATRPSAAPLTDALYEIRWEPTPLASSSTAKNNGPWLFLADRPGFAQRTAEHLRALRIPCTLIDSAADLASHLSMHPHGVADFRALDIPAPDHNTLASSQKILTSNLLDLIKQLASSSVDSPSPSASNGSNSNGHASAPTTPPRLVLITSGAVATSPTQSKINPAQAIVWGAAQAIREEHPEFHCTCLDLDPTNSASAESARSLTAEFTQSSTAAAQENQLAFRSAQRLAARLTRHHLAPSPRAPLRLAIPNAGMLDNLVIEAAYRRAPALGQVEIQIDAAGLNFRDVLAALGMYPGPAAVLGSECSGRIIAIGADADAHNASDHAHTSFKIGDEIIAFTPSTHDGYISADPRLVAPKPRNLSLAAAAGIPTAFLTARYALENVAKIHRGDRVLIHAAAGGVGLAAVQIAQRASAEIFATAGSDRKRDYLRSLGIKHIFNSRALDFAREILALTEGRGVDVVLNSLAGEFIPATFSVVAPNGRFVELGKRDLWSPEQVTALGRNIAYHIVDLAPLAVDQPELIGALLRDTVKLIESGELHVLPTETFAFLNAVAAYRHMSQAHHLGKIVLRQPSASAHISPNATYLVAGGTGGIGLSLAQFILDRGAKNLVLLSRRGGNEKTAAFIEAADKQGAQILVVPADIADRDELAKLLHTIEHSMPPLRGIIHAAGILEDSTLLTQSAAQFEKVLAPKVQGAWNLHELTAHAPVDFFVLFSSVAAILGAPGQASYAAANAFEDALAHFRRAHHQPATSINWGAWSEGMAANAGLENRREKFGIHTFTAPQALALFENILFDSPAQVAAAAIDWTKFLHRYSTENLPNFYTSLSTSLQPPRAATSAQQRTKADSLVEKISAAPAAGRFELLREHVHSLALRVLGFSASRRLEFDQPLSDLGLDSLMAVEFRNALSADAARTLPATILFSHPSIQEVTTYLFARLFGPDSQPPAHGNAQTSTSPAAPSDDDLLAGIEDLSDEEVERRLAHNSRSTGDSR
jgi:acyl transferase domain-containing protein